MCSTSSSDLISVIVPIYKVEGYLEQCIESICHQTYRRLEIILVDDGSPDSCPELCEKYALMDERIKVYHKKNGGLSDARNYGLDVSNGKYIIFVDSDDYIEEDMIQKLYSSLIENEADLIIGGISYVDEVGNRVSNIQENLPIGIMSQQDFWDMYQSEYMIPCVVTWNKIYKKNLFDEVRFAVGKYHEDEFIIHKIISQCKKIVCISDEIYNYRQRKNSIMSEQYSVKHLDIVEALLERSLFFFYEHNMRLAEKTLALAIGKLLKAYAKLDFSNEENKMRYEELRTCFVKLYWKYVCSLASLRFTMNVMTFVIHEKCYIATHKTKLKKYI